APAFTGLGDSPAGTISSPALKVTPHGLTAVGVANSLPGAQGFRCSPGGGVAGLGDLPGGTFDGAATGVSADGTASVAWSASADGTQEAVRWPAAAGVVGLGDVAGGI